VAPVASRLAYVACGLLLMAGLAGCVSMPSSGPVQAYSVTQGSGAQSQRYLQMIPEPPGADWSPSEIVRGFLTASASFADQQRTAREYLTASASRDWNPTWSATVFGSGGPDVGPAAFSGGGKRKPATAATVTVTGPVQASLSGSGAYAVPSGASTAGGQSYPFDLVKADGQWRISRAPKVLLLTSFEFKTDYQLQNLYFFDPTSQYLVPDPVYVPLQTTPSNLMDGLVEDLIKPPKDWLHGATRTAFPGGTKLISDVMLDGTAAAVNLGGAITRAPIPVLEQVSAQLLSTLSGSSQGQPLVQSVELIQDGKPWSPPGAQGNPVQHDTCCGYSVPTGTSSQFYYLDSSGVLLRRDGANGAVGTPAKVASISPGYSVIAVSRDGRYLAALRNGTVYAGLVGGRLVARTGNNAYTSVSWGPNDELWAAGSNGIVMLHANASPRSAAWAQVQVQVLGWGGNPVPGPFTALSVAPDGVRVAVIIGIGQSSELNFGAIVAQPPARGGQQAQVKIQLSQINVSGTNASFQSVTWYGPDNVITLAESASGSVLAEYPVDGGTATRILSQPDIVSIAASYGSALIAAAKNGTLLSDPSTSGSWATISPDTGLAPTYPG
jgi:hypothetical protein